MSWSSAWFDWLLFIAISFAALELYSVYDAHLRGEKNIATWTLSDTIRRWSSARRWLAPIVIGGAAWLMTHFFLVANAS